MVLQDHMINLKEYISTTINAYDQQTWQGGDLQWGAVTYKIKWSFDHVALWDYKLKTYLHYRSAHGRQSWQDVDLTWRASTDKVKWLLSHMVLWLHVKNWKNIQYHKVYCQQILQDVYIQ